MPMKPGKDESQSDFMSRCVPEMMGDGDREQEQAVAACASMWRTAKGKNGGPPAEAKQLDDEEGESHSEFMTRCMDEVGDRDECELMWEERSAGKKKVVRKTHSQEVIVGREFVLSDASMDRFGDTINPHGWSLDNFKRNPIALFNHDKSFVIGKWENMRVLNNALRSHLRLAPAGTSPRIDEIRRLVDADILIATSVGFLPIEMAPKTKSGAKGDVYKRQELVEASLVSVPANPNTLAVAKGLGISADTLRLVFAEHGTRNVITTNRRFTGKHAETSNDKRRKAFAMSTSPLAERIETAQARITKMREQLEAHVKSIDDENPDEAATATTEELDARIEAQQRNLDSLKRIESKMFTDGNSREGGNGSGSGIGTGQVIVPQRPFAEPAKKITPADHVIRSLVVAVKRHVDANRKEPEFYLAQTYGENRISEQTRVVMDVVTRAAVAPANTTTAGWAAELVQVVWADFMETLMPAAIYPGLSSRGLRLTFGRNGQINIPSRNRATSISGSFVGEGSPIPVRKGLFASVPLVPKKMGVISTFTRQIAEHSTPAIEGLIRSAIQEDTAVAIDVVLLDSTTSSAIRPAGILNGVTALTATAGGGFNALVGDIKNLTGALIGTTAGNLRKPVWLMNPIQQLSISLTQNAGGDFPFKAEINNNTFQGYPVVVSATVTAGTVIIVDAADFVSVTGDEPKFDVSDQAVLHEEDTTPLALGTVGTPATIAAPARSLWQTDTLAIRMLLDINWALRRTGVVAYTTGVTW
jgi:HK97 family phage major capsid protein/HK97 family phage prohead protease